MIKDTPSAILFNTVAAVSGFYRDPARQVSPVCTVLVLGLIAVNMLVVPRVKALDVQKASIRAILVCLLAALGIWIMRPPLVLSGLLVLLGLRELWAAYATYGRGRS